MTLGVMTLVVTSQRLDTKLLFFFTFEKNIRFVKRDPSGWLVVFYNVPIHHYRSVSSDMNIDFDLFAFLFIHCKSCNLPHFNKYTRLRNSSDIDHSFIFFVVFLNFLSVIKITKWWIMRHLHYWRHLF